MHYRKKRLSLALAQSKFLPEETAITSLSAQQVSSLKKRLLLASVQSKFLPEETAVAFLDAKQVSSRRNGCR